MHHLHIADHPGQQHVVLTRNGKPQEYYLHRPAAPDGAGDLHAGRVMAVVPAMAGAFVEIAGAEAFLPDSEAPGGLTAGTILAVRVTRAAHGGKGPRVSARVEGVPVAGPVRLLQRGPTPLEELRAAYPEAPLSTAPFSDDLQSELDALADPHFALPGGMRATATPTPALTAIDLDGAAGTAARAGKASAQYAANLAALPELARQISLRNFGGAVLVDFAGMPAKRRAALQAPLQAALACDRMRPRLVGVSGLGFAEILRPRLRPPLHEKLQGPHAAGLAALRLAAARARACSAERLALRATPAVISAMQADSAALAALAHVTTHPLILRSDPALQGYQTVIEPA
jgi:ribonuclease G